MSITSALPSEFSAHRGESRAPRGAGTELRLAAAHGWCLPRKGTKGRCPSVSPVQHMVTSGARARWGAGAEPLGGHAPEPPAGTARRPPSTPAQGISVGLVNKRVWGEGNRQDLGMALGRAGSAGTGAHREGHPFHLDTLSAPSRGFCPPPAPPGLPSLLHPLTPARFPS